MSLEGKARSWYERIPAWARPMAARLFSTLTGLALAVLLHYLLYRFGLPSKPFIYVAF